MKNPYLTPSRLADVLALIQVLAYDKWAKRWQAGLVTLLRRGPQSATDWIQVGSEHPELFRVLEPDENSDRQPTVALITRLLQKSIPSENPGEPTLLPPLTSDVAAKLMELAVTLHDRAVQRSDRLKTVTVPLVVAIIAAAAVITAAVLNLSKPVASPPAIFVQPPEPGKVAPPVKEVPTLPAPVQPQEQKAQQQ